MSVTDDLPNFANEIKQLMDDAESLPPVDSWRPDRQGEIDICIDRTGHWHYRGELMEREAIPRLFSRILRREGVHYFLVTPVEKLQITVEELPFIVRLMDVVGEGRDQVIYLSTNMGDHFTLDTSHRLAFDPSGGVEPIPMVHVRSGLYAKLASPVYYELANKAEASDANPEVFGVWSQSRFFELS